MSHQTKYHFIGIGGIGMSGLARILLSQNKEVSGSDIAHNYVIDSLIGKGAKIALGHHANNITKEMTVVYSSDIKKENPEFQTAQKLACPLLHRSELLNVLMNGYKTLAVTGTHGKTTTSALLTWVFHQAQLDPAYAVGGVISHLKSNAGHGSGNFFIAEADESDGSFLTYHPFGAIITNIDNDHLSHFGSEKALVNAFLKFMAQIKSAEHTFWCGDDSHLNDLNAPGFSYGFGCHNQLKASQFRQSGWSIEFDIHFKGHHYPKVQVALTGIHNALNALAIFGLALQCGISEKIIREAFLSFGGVARRCEKKGEVNSVLILDDYAHHPTEIATTLKAIREAIQERRLIVVFQPHRFTRTQDCLGSYSGIFNTADEVIITEIFGAGEQPIPGITHEAIFAELNQTNVKHIPRKEVLQYLIGTTRPHDVIVTLGAGDITKLGTELTASFQKECPKKFKVGVIFGGRSGEHPISLLSAKHICQSLKEECYEVQQFGISQDGKWLTGKQLLPESAELTSEITASSDGDLLSPQVLQELLSCDILFPVLHGPNGEDGTIQGFFEMLNKPYVGCDFRSSAICMEKAIAKTLVLLAGIPTSPFVSFKIDEWQANSLELIAQIKNDLRLPVFVKPVHLGSTIGIQKVTDWNDLTKAIQDAFKVDSCLLVENGLEMREIEFAVMGNGTSTYTFPPGEVFTQGNVYDFQAKYGNEAIPVDPQANIPENKIKEGMELARRAYQAVGCNGMARVDFFLDLHGKYWFNEINPIPGFTRNSLYPQICRKNGLDSSLLMDRLIILALHRKRKGL